MAVEVKEVRTNADLMKFIRFPMQLYKGNPYYVPPLIIEERQILNREKNPVFKHAETKYYLAYRDKKIVGRIAAIVNWKEVKEQGKSKARFGWFDMIDDLEVTQALLEKAEEFAKEKNLKSIEGPVGFSNLDKAGLLIKGYDEIATNVTLYNFPYYVEHLEKLGYTKESEWVEYKLDAPTTLPEKVVKFTNLIKKRYGLKVLKFNSKKDMIDVIDPMFDLLDKTYGHLSSYVPIPKEQIEHYKDKYIKFINTDFVTFLADKDDKLVAFAITMPSYAKALQKAKGRLLPFGWWHLLKASKKNESAAFYLIGIDPKLQGKGVTAIVFNEMFKTFTRYGVKYLETNPELEENKHIQVLWGEYNPVNHKRRRSYSKQL